MKISVTVKPNAREEKGVRADTGYVIYVKASAFENKANKALIEALSTYFNIRKSQIAIVSGKASRRKIIEID